jgi:hypothetical protein
MEVTIMQEILMDFDENDNPVISVKGVKGKSCKDVTKGIEQALGKVISSQTTPEYNEREASNVTANNRASDKRRR